MPKKRKVKRKTYRKKIKKVKDDSQVMFDSTKGNTDSLFMAGADGQDNTVRFVSFKAEDQEKLKEELKGFDIKFLDI